MGYPYYRELHILYDGARLPYAIAAMAALAAIAPLFCFCSIQLRLFFPAFISTP